MKNSPKDILEEILKLRSRKLVQSRLDSDNVLDAANSVISAIKNAKHPIRVSYTSKYGHLVAYYYWLARIERRMVFEFYCQRDGISTGRRSKRVFKYLSKKLKEALFQATLKHGWQAQKIESIEGRCARFAIGGIKGHVFYSPLDLLVGMGKKPTPPKGRASVYEKILIANSLGITS